MTIIGGLENLAEVAVTPDFWKFLRLWGCFSSSQVLVSCDGNGFTDELIEMLPELWSDEQQAAGRPWNIPFNVKVQEASRGISCANR